MIYRNYYDGERRFEDQKFPGFAIFNDFGTATGGTISPFGVFNNNNAAADQVGSTTFKPEVTTLNFPSLQPQLSNGVTFANLLKRARLRTSEDTTITTPLSYTEEDETTTLPSFTTTITATSSIPTTTLSTTPTTSTSTTTRRPLTTLNELYSSRASSRYKPRTVTSLNPIVAQRLISSSRIPESRFIISKRRQSLGRARRKTTTQATTTTTTTTTASTTSMPTTTTTTTTTTTASTTSM